MKLSRLIAITCFGLLLLHAHLLQAQGTEKKSDGDKPDRGQGVVATCAAFSPDNKFVLVGFGGGSTGKQPERTALADSLVLYDVANGKEIRRLKGHPRNAFFPAGVSFVCFLPDGKRAVSGFGGGVLRAWDVRSGEELWTVQTLELYPGGALLPDGKHLIIYSGDTIELWDIVAGNRLQTAKFPELKTDSGIVTPNIDSVVLSSNGDMAFVASYTSNLWDVRKWRLLTEFKQSVTRPLGFSAISRPAAFSPDSKYLVARKDGKGPPLVLWDIAKQEEIRELGDKDLKPINVIFSSDGKIIAHNDAGRLVCWNTEGKVLWETKSKDLEHLRFFVSSKDRKLALSNDGGLFVAGERSPAFIDSESTLSLRIWNLEKGTFIRTLTWPKLPEDTEAKGEPK